MKKIFLFAFCVNFSLSLYSQSNTHYINGYKYSFEADSEGKYWDIYRGNKWLMDHPKENDDNGPYEKGSYSISGNIITFKTIINYSWGRKSRIQKYIVSDTGGCTPFSDKTYDY